MTEKWIPGPYAVDEDHRPGMAYNRHIVLDRDHDMRIAFMAHDDGRYEEFRATAFLLAAAPNLAKALMAILRMPINGVPLRDWEGSPAVMDGIDALAEARGERR